MDKQQVFKNLVENAISYLEKSEREFSGEPKYSLIHFCSAVELFLKARLMAEHWGLMASDIRKARWNEFASGEVNTVGMDEAITRLSQFADDAPNEAQAKAFENVRKYRNKLIHFYLEEQRDEQRFRETIAAKQCVAWYHLHYLVVSTWKEVFRDFTYRIHACDAKMRERRQYLEARYEQIRPSLKEFCSLGIPITDCPSCGFVTFGRLDYALTKHSRPIIKTSCPVCGFYSTRFNVVCPSCAEAECISPETLNECVNCGKRIDEMYIREKLERVEFGLRNGEGHADIHCGYCGYLGSVFPVGPSHLLCGNCLKMFTLDDALQCRRCGDFQIDLQPSIFDLCLACSGTY